MSGETPVWAQLAIPILTATCAALGTVAVSQYQKAKSSREESAAKELSSRLKYLDPLRLAAESLTWHLSIIEQKIKQKNAGTGGLEWMLKSFHCIKEPQNILGRELSQKEFLFWCNGEGFFAVSTIYIVAIYFFYARQVRQKYIFDGELLMKLDNIRMAFGHEYGIYALIQDSIGEYLRIDESKEISYREFCTRIYNEEERVWVLNALDYFREIDKKTDQQRHSILEEINSLISYIGNKTSVKVNLPPK